MRKTTPRRRLHDRVYGSLIKEMAIYDSRLMNNLIEKFGFTHDQVAQIWEIDRSTATTIINGGKK